jgi:D-inositol-3-phosphate glycosyltransferase
MKIGLVSFHTCPMANLGEKDAGGMNVYLLNLAARLDSMGHTVYVFTRSHEH